jgi:hypothetical protein
MKMAKKRALVDAALTATGMSDRFTQYEDDEDHSTGDVIDVTPTKPDPKDVTPSAPSPTTSIMDETEKAWATVHELSESLGWKDKDLALHCRSNYRQLDEQPINSRKDMSLRQVEDLAGYLQTLLKAKQGKLV